MKEPAWKIVLNWGAVILFLTVPLGIASLQIYINTHRGVWQWVEELTPEQRIQRFQYLYDFMRNLTILVFGLAGLRTWQHVSDMKNGNHKERKQKDEATALPTR